ncbi:2-oxoglutarate dehydrogenase E1 component [Deinococcus psychrotolerans]|uniref:oxoglutarate dehydrogenase (succinyl-transferring) n=1 Tax=Deinococcus psychrotolerans TaxID=2489213 RepID=A0A3G8YCV4_9DEIO|nr:2-oxoglutarate dehydrogenase E1 component [Deinococcus psychrotolerans]AZI42760.1 2-oxoglutarate dehydrogenase E1 component [Deinococcus psychrotolerans]
MDDSQHATVMYGGNAAFVEALYEAYLTDPASVDSDWRSYFDDVRGGIRETAHTEIQQRFYDLGRNRLRAGAAPTESGGENLSAAQQAAGALISAYRVYGHISASKNPLTIRPPAVVPELTPEYYNLSAQDLMTPVKEGHFSGSLQGVIDQLEQSYCGPIGFEFSYLPSAEREWFQQRIEASKGRGSYTTEQKKRIYDKLNAAEGLEKYLHQRYVGQKRFSLEGGEAFIPLMDALIQGSGLLGIKETVIGMAHRGRLNVLVNIFGKKPADLFDEFEGKKVLSDDPDVAGDVKYHMGFSSDVRTNGGPMHLALAFNPSHLEIVSPVVHGSVRARQDHRDDTERKQVLPITIHGDAAVAGQGVVMETLNLSRLRGFSTGGAVRIVINNQIGFTISDPRDTRSSRYCTDIAKIANAPVMHVNGDDPEAVVYAGELALAYRQEFGKDVFVDLICFRRHGHNEGDDPTMTQPIMYREIKTHPGTRALYAKILEKEGVLRAGEEADMITNFRDKLDAGASVVTEVANEEQSKLAINWGRHLGTHWTDDAETQVSAERIAKLGESLSSVPEGFVPHRAVERVLKNRREMSLGEQPVDWGMGETLAYATLLEDGFDIRLDGQDAGRGTFVHRHAVLHDQSATDTQNEEYMPLAHLPGTTCRIEVIDSTLSEEAVLAFEYGYSTSAPESLVIWEAQFGDFANGAQAVIDQFVSAGESKWQRLSALTLLLPHGYEGQGPEHSSARLERYLQLCAQKNMQVVVPSSASQIFHLLRRQMIRAYRKPLIIMSPKSLLRNKAAMSPLSDFTDGKFYEVIGDTSKPAARRVVISSGKLHWELTETRQKAEDDGQPLDVALIRLEQLYPFPGKLLAQELEKYPGADVIWAQEEPQNQGAWLMLRDDLDAALQPGQTLTYAGRSRSASTAVGYKQMHDKQQAQLIRDALGAQVEVEQSRPKKEATPQS